MGNKKKYTVGIDKVCEGGDDKILAIMMHGAMNANEDLQKALYTACKLQDEIDIDNNSNN